MKQITSIFVIMAIFSIFIVFSSEQAHAIKASSAFGTLQIDRTEYDVTVVNSTIVKVNGTISNLISGDSKVTLVFTLPDGSTKGSEISANNDGTFETTLQLDSNSQKGEYSVFASYVSTPIAALSFTVKQIPFHIALLNSTPKQIISNYTIKAETTSQTPNGTKTILSSANPTLIIPSWIKNTARWWSEDSVGDNDFLKGIQYLVQQKTILVSTVQVSSQKSQGIPAWIKNTAKWWAENQVGDSDFVKGIEYLVQNGIIQINNNQTQTVTPIENHTNVSNSVQSTNQQLQTSTSVANTIDNFSFKSINSNPDNYKNNWVKFVGKVNHLQSDQNIIQFDTDPNSSDLSSQVFVALVNNSTNQFSEGDCLLVEGHITGTGQYTYALSQSATNLQMTGEKITKISCLDAIYPSMKTIYPNESQQLGNVKITINKVEFAEKHTRVYITIENLNTERQVTFAQYDSHIIQDQSQYSYTSSYGTGTKDIDTTILPGIVENGYIFYDPVPQNSFKLLLEADEESLTSDLNDPNFSWDQLNHKFTFDIPVQ